MVLEFENSTCIGEGNRHSQNELFAHRHLSFYRSECPLGLRSAKPLAVDWSKSADMNN